MQGGCMGRGSLFSSSREAPSSSPTRGHGDALSWEVGAGGLGASSQCGSRRSRVGGRARVRVRLMKSRRQQERCCNSMEL